MEKIIIYGNSDFAELMTFYLKSYYKIEAYCVDEKYIKENTFLGKPLISFDKVCREYSPSEYKFFVAIGYNKINTIREDIFKRVKEHGYNCISYVHPSVILPEGFTVKENVILLENVVIQPYAEISENTVIFPNSVICHNSKIGKNCFISSCVCVNGFVEVQENTFLGANSTIRNNIKIGKKCLIGAGCTVLESKDDGYCCKSVENVELNVKSESLKV